MPLDAICMSAVLEELRPILVGGKIDKVAQPNREEIVLAIRGGGQNVKLLLSANPGGPRMHFTREVRENPATPPMFCMLMRKHLTGGRILAVEQPPDERIVQLRLEVLNDLGDRVPRTLVLEAMGRRANLILLDEENRIIDCIRRIGGDLSAQRSILPGLFYHLPELRPGVSPLIGRELAFRGLSEDQVEEMTQGVFQPTMLLRGGKSVDFTFLPVLQYGPETISQPYESFSQLLDDFYASREAVQKGDQKGSELLKAVQRAKDRVVRRIAQQEQELLSTLDRERKREIGDLLTSNLYAMEKGMAKLRCVDFYDPEGGEVEIPLDPLLTPQQNAAKYYKAYTKAKTAEGILTLQIEKGKVEQNYLESVLESVRLAEGERDLQEIRLELTASGYLRRGAKATTKTKVTTKPMEFRSTAGLRITVGKNNTQNDKLTTKLAGKQDLWFHTQKIHGSHVILWTEGMDPDLESVTQAARLAAWFSQAQESTKVPVDYTPVRHVKKPGGARPGMVVYTTYQTAYVDPDRELVKALRVK